MGRNEKQGMESPIAADGGRSGTPAAACQALPAGAKVQ